MSTPQTPATFLAALPDEQLRLAKSIRSSVRKAAPRSTELIRRGALFFEADGPICFIQPHRAHLNLGFWRGAHLADPDSLLEGSGKHQRHIKIRTDADVRSAAIGRLVRAAVRLNREVPYT